jgi:hypothetical protein
MEYLVLILLIVGVVGGIYFYFKDSKDEVVLPPSVNNTNDTFKPCKKFILTATSEQNYVLVESCDVTGKTQGYNVKGTLEVCGKSILSASNVTYSEAGFC